MELKESQIAADYQEMARMALDNVRPNDSVLIGQPRALHALTLGLELNARGYNIMVNGPSGTGRMTAVRRILTDIKPPQPLLDLVYVYNFEEPEKPKLMTLNAGKGTLLKKAIHDLVERLKNAVKTELSGGDYMSLRDSLAKKIEEAENKALANLESNAALEGFRVVQIQDEDGEAQTDMEPLHLGKAMGWEEYQNLIVTGNLTQIQFQEKRETYLRIMSSMKSLFEDLRVKREQAEDDMDGMAVNYLGETIRREVKRAGKGFRQPEQRIYFQALEKDILSHLFLFSSDKPLEDSWGNPGFIRYGVHVLLDRSKAKLAPVVYETRCDPSSLLGTVDVRVEPNGETRSNFMQIRAGALVQAYGGYLVLRAEDLLTNEENWTNLLRVLDTGLVDIQAPQSPLGPVAFPIKPQSIPIQVKVILIGPEGSYDYLAEKDPNFLRLFKISAEFDSVMDSTIDAAAEYIRFMQSQIQHKSLLPLHLSGMASVLEYGHRLAGDRKKISTLFSRIADILTESSYWAKKESLKEIQSESVIRALSERHYLFSLPEEKIDEEWARGRLLINVEGWAIGQVNGLAVLDRGFYRFGRPLRITAAASPGRGGIVNIEGKAGLSGRIHTKGVLILEGLLKSLFARDSSFSMNASVAFEQNYGGVEGDSASSAEACALISALGRFPLRQDIAISGSINQAGEIQSVGGITEKVEGFYSVCKQKGLAGQGVILPYSDIDHLTLKIEICEAVGKKDFYLYGVSTLGQALFVLTGREFGVMNKNGEYPINTLGFQVIERLNNLKKKSNSP